MCEMKETDPGPEYILHCGYVVRGGYSLQCIEIVGGRVVQLVLSCTQKTTLQVLKQRRVHFRACSHSRGNEWAKNFNQSASLEQSKTD